MAALVSAQRRSEELLRRTRRDRRLAEAAARELEAQKVESNRRIDQYIARLTTAGAEDDGRAPVGGEFEALKGLLPWPVVGDVIGSFGRRLDTSTDTYTRSRGIDIAAGMGDDVLAVAGGRVVMVDWYRGYGTFVIISHDAQHHTLSAHLESVAVRLGDQVRQGQVIGKVGDSGTLGEAKLHFELIVGREAVDRWIGLLRDEF